MRACYPRARDVRRIPTITLLLLAALLGSLVAGASWASLVALFGLLASLVFALRRLDLALGLTLAIAFFFAPIKDFLPSSLSYFVVDLMLLVCVVSWVATKVLHREAILEASPLRVPILALVLYAAALVFHPGRPVLAGVAGWRAWSLFLVLYFVGFDLARERGVVPRALAVLYGLGIAVAVLGIVQHEVGLSSAYQGGAALEHHRRVFFAASDGATFRVFSTMISAGALGNNLAILLVLAAGEWSAGRPRGARRVLLLVLAVTGGVCLVWTGSRSAWITGAAALVAMLAVRPAAARRLVPAAAGGAVVLAVAFLLGGRAFVERASSLADPSLARSRVLGRRFLEATHIAAEQPLGAGLGITAGIPRSLARRLGVETRNMDDGYGAALLEMGWPGLALYVVLHVSILAAALRAARRLRGTDHEGAALGILGMVVIVFLAAFVSQSFYGVPHGLYYWFLLGGILRRARDEGAGAPELAGGVG